MKYYNALMALYLGNEEEQQAAEKYLKFSRGGSRVIGLHDLSSSCQCIPGP